MSDGYPTEETLEQIRKWRIGRKDTPEFTLQNIEALLDLIEGNCRWPEFSIHYELAVNDLDDIVVRFHYSTGGWSGHEELIGELEHTFFWMFCWVQSRRGGHYIFEIEPNAWKDETASQPTDKNE
jgi:hypothetical protein